MNNKKQWISEKSAGAILTHKTVVAESFARIGTPYFARRRAVGTITAAILCVELSTNFHFVPSKVFQLGVYSYCLNMESFCIPLAHTFAELKNFSLH